MGLLQVNLNNIEKEPAIIEKLIKNIMELPIWVKQYIYLIMRDDLGNSIDIEKFDTKKTKDLVQMYEPVPTSYGKRSIPGIFNNKRSGSETPVEQSLLLGSLGKNKKIIDICNERKWSLKKCSQILVKSIEMGYVETIENNEVSNTVYYLAGKIRLGEYLLRMSKLSLGQVDHALLTQKQISEDEGSKIKIGDILVNLGYIKEADKNDILGLQEASGEILNVEDETLKIKENLAEAQKSIEELKFENEGLKQDLEVYQEELINIRQEQKKKIKKKSYNLLNNLFRLTHKLKIQ